MGSEIILYDYWRSSASYRVRIALGLLGLRYESRVVNLLKAEQRAPAYLALNPQGLLPTLVIGGRTFTQSLAIIEHLHATTPGSTLLPGDDVGRCRVRQLSYAVAMEIHPVCNLGVAQHVADLTGGGNEAKAAWMRRFIAQGLESLEALLATLQEQTDDGPFCFGALPTMADCCLTPQLYNAERWGVDYGRHRRIARAAEAARELEAFRAAHPDAVGPPP